MTLQELINRIGQVDPRILLAIFAAPPLLAWLLSKCHRYGSGGRPPWRFLYSGLVYLVCIPGLLAGVLVAYHLFFLRQNLLQVNLFVYFLPLLSMIGTLVLVGRQADWADLPGVDRLYALMVILVVTFGVTLAIQKTRIWIVFGGTIRSLLLIALGCFLLLKWASWKLFRSSENRRFPDDAPSSPARRRSDRAARSELERMKRKMGIRD